MFPTTLGYRTDLMIHRFDAAIDDRGDYLRVEAHDNPNYFSGNLLLFRDRPGPGDAERWPALFAREFGNNPAIRHVTLGWDDAADAPGEVAPLVRAGYALTGAWVMAARQVRPPPRPARGFEIREVAGDADWAAVRALTAAVDTLERQGGVQVAFKDGLFRRYRRIVEAGRGFWLAAWAGGRPVAHLGMVVGEGFGRFQSVETLPDFRRRGLAGTLVHEAGCRALERRGAETLVIVATEDGPRRIYQSVGFEVAERQWEAMLTP